MSEWISVKDRLPENENEMVLVTDGKTVITGFRNWMYRSEPDSRLFVPGLKMGGGCMEVTHWMPLPEPPSKNATTRPTSLQDHIDREAWASEWLYDADKDTYSCANCRHTICASDYFENILPPYCEMCGKAMTPEAWDELEKRLRG